MLQVTFLVLSMTLLLQGVREEFDEQWRIFQQWDSEETVVTTQHGVDDQMPALAPSQPEEDAQKGTLAKNRNVSQNQITPGAFVNHLI